MMPELEAVMKAIQGLGADAREAFIWWLILQAFTTCLVTLGLLTLIGAVYRLARYWIACANGLNRFKIALGRQPYSCWREQDVEDILDRLRSSKT